MPLAEPELNGSISWLQRLEKAIAMQTQPTIPAATNSDNGSPSRFQRFWRRYSPHGELPVSTAASISFHAFVILVFALGLASFANRNSRPPAVDCVAISGGEGDSAAPGFGDDGLPSGAGAGTGGDSGPTLMQTTPDSNDAPLPTTGATSLDTDVAPERAEEADLGPIRPVTGTDIANRAAAALQQIKEQQAKTLGGGGGGGGPGGTGRGSGGDGTGGGGKGGAGGNAKSGRAARQSRWVLRFNTRSAADYLAQMAGLGAAIAFPADGGKLLYLDLAKDPPARSTRDISEITRICWYDEDPSSVRRVTEHLRLPSSSTLLTYLPQQLEERLLKLELAYRGLAEERIKSTQFEVVRTGGGYDVQVVSQESW